MRVCDVVPRPGTLRSAAPNGTPELLLRTVCFRRRQRTDYFMSYHKDLTKAQQCESIEMDHLKTPIVCLRGPYNGRNVRLPSRVSPERCPAGRNREQTDHKRTSADVYRGANSKCCRATEGSTACSSLLVFGIHTVLWYTASKGGGKWYRGVLEAAARFMGRGDTKGRGGEELATQREGSRGCQEWHQRETRGGGRVLM